MSHYLTVALLFTMIWTGPSGRFAFDNVAEGALPNGWTSDISHDGGVPNWQVVRSNSAPSPPNVLAQLSQDATSGRFPLAIFDRLLLKDGLVSVKYRPVSGKVDQAAGIVWRYQDHDNYYITRANALENNVVLYKVEMGKRTPLAPKGSPVGTYGVKHPVPSGAWSTLTVQFVRDTFKVMMDGTKLFEVQDSTFAGPGRIGLWTKADSVTHFDDFAYEGN